MIVSFLRDAAEEKVIGIKRNPAARKDNPNDHNHNSGHSWLEAIDYVIIRMAECYKEERPYNTLYT